MSMFKSFGLGSLLGRASPLYKICKPPMCFGSGLGGWLPDPFTDERYQDIFTRIRNRERREARQQQQTTRIERKTFIAENGVEHECYDPSGKMYEFIEGECTEVEVKRLEGKA